MTMSTSTHVNSLPNLQVELAVPFWIVGERRKDPGALSRHIQQRNGTAPFSSLRRRRDDRPSPPPERMIELWRAGS